MRLWTAAIGMAAIVGLDAMTGCSGGHGQIVMATCGAQDLSATASVQGATGSLRGSVSFTNHAQHACQLSGYLDVHLLGPDHRALAVQIVRSSTDPRTNDATGPAVGQSQAVVLAPGKTNAARFVAKWMNWCGQRLSDAFVQIRLPGGDIVANVSLGGEMPACNGRRSGLNIGPVTT